MDRIRIIPDQLFLTEEAANRKNTVEPFTRRVNNKGKESPKKITLTLGLPRHSLIRLISHRLDCGWWQIATIDANLPALLRGHNSSPIQSNDELALALTRLHFFTSLLIEPDGHQRIIPGVGTRNHGFVKYLESMIQIRDPDQNILIGSHICKKHYQHRSHLVSWGESTYVKGDELAISFYDKAAQRRKGKVTPKGIPGTRIECILKNPERLAEEVRKTGIYTGEPGEVVSTVSLETAYEILRLNLDLLTGFDLVTDRSLVKGNKVADLLMMGLGEQVKDPHSVDLALEKYKRQRKPKERTFKDVSKHLRALAVRHVAGESMHLLPTKRSDLKSSLIQMQAEEREFTILCRDLGAPDSPAKDILNAWSQTTFLKSKPSPLDLKGHHLPHADSPWRYSQAI